ncbi:glycosyltransferase family 4 protein [Frondihabitans australicus]|uniref:D-inositol 3-phosphate glycosyltransferase n=1 Tax=Frondihabitans australicus TaxID=386892 RepID=A0A495IGE6_9MICO|nr:glycosyltransferase family 4 protein [Frondihabitans australicus]RKR74819.1 glycosyltransferase involved in cell wall biosynthesis [Frondihabitans australicus]
MPSTTGSRSPRWLVGVTEYAGLTAYTGGIGRHYASLLPGLVRAGIDVDLIVFSRGDLVRREPPGGVRLVAHRRLPLAPAWIEPVVRALDFRAIAGLRRYDRILLPEWGGIGAALPRSAPLVTNLATGMRLSDVISGVRAAELPWSRRVVASVQRWCEEAQIRHSRGVLPISTAMDEATRRLVRDVPPGVVVRNCVEVESVRRGAATASVPEGWPAGDGPVVLFLGRLERRKGVIDAAEAFSRVAACLPETRFVFAGAPGDSRFEPTVADLDALLGRAAPHTRILGHVPGDELYAAIAHATVVVCPSRWEGFGQVALEAKALGRPLVVTTGSGYDDFCTDDVDSLMVRPADSRALARAIETLVQDPGRAARLGAAAQAGVDRFTADAVAPDVVDAVTRLGALPMPSRRLDASRRRRG